ncbi:MAG: putative rane protein, partial [Mycobacterium sp.]|nr:putative rane protein [Mycobacterium sp.]
MLVFQLIFGSSYIGAFHNPKAEGIPLGVAAPTPALATQLKQLVEKNAGGSLSVRIVDAAKARQLVESRKLDGAYLLGKTGDT